jgi:hypothetical protein
MKFEEFKQKYALLNKTHNLPDFDEMNNSFDIGKIRRDSGNLIRDIRRVMIEKISYYNKLLEMMINPSNASPIFLMLLNEITMEDKIVTEVYDKDQTLIASQLLKSQQVTSTDIIISGGQFGPNLPLTIANKMIGSSGVGTWLGEMTLLYVPIAGEKIVFDWNYNGDASAAVSPIDNIRQAPADLKIEKVLVSESIALSGSSIFNINVGNINSTPTNIFQTTSKPSLSFGSTGASFQGAEKFVLENQVISRNQIITAGFDQLASGSRDVCIQLITHRM